MWNASEFVRQFFSFERPKGDFTGWKELWRYWRSYRNKWRPVRNLLQLLRPAWFAGLITLIVAAALQVGQAIDILVDHSGDGFGSPRRWWLFLAALALAISGFYFPRALLYVRYRFTPSCTERRFEPLRRWVPRLLGALPLLSLALAAARAGIWGLAVGYLLAALIFLRALAVRRYLLFGPLSQNQGRVLLHPELPDRTFRWMLFYLGVSTVGFFVFLASRTNLPQNVGSLGIVFLAAASWIAFGSLVLVYASYRFVVPALLIAVVWWGVCSLYNDNHGVRTLAAKPGGRPSVAAHLEEWLGFRGIVADSEGAGPGPPYPVVVAAAQGGGIRAGYWTAAALSALEDEIPGFTCRLFAISGVSGGSVGAAVFAAQIAEQLETNADWACDPKRKQTAGLLQEAQAVLSRDSLAPTLAGWLYPDIVQRFLPVPFLPDRASYLEGAWEAGWRLAHDSGSDRLAQALGDLWPQDDPALGDDERQQRRKMRLQVPSLFLNGTWVENGERNVTSNLRVTAADGFTELDDVMDRIGQPIPLSTAAHMGARFPYISPAGTIGSRDEKRRVVDGGYFEVSGALTASELVDLIARRCGQRCRPVVLYLKNSEPPANDDDGKGRVPLPETLSPLRALFATQGARGRLAVEQLFDRPHKEVATHQFALEHTDDRVIPLGWALSKQVQQAIGDQLDLTEPPPDPDPAASFRTVKQILKEELNRLR